MKIDLHIDTEWFREMPEPDDVYVTESEYRIAMIPFYAFIGMAVVFAIAVLAMVK